MAGGFPLTRWPVLAGLWALAAGLAVALPATALDWQPSLAWQQPWRFFSAAFVHWSAQHLIANLAGCAMLAWLGAAAHLPARCSGAWLLAWPLTQAGLLAWPALAHYGGLSGLLHAGAAVAVIELLHRRGHERLIGAALALGLATKLWLEQPLVGPPLREVAGWDILLAPAAHLCGVLAGALAWAISALATPRLGRRRA